jgi:2-hydroxychromene-2-carboxylate isomerase
MIAGVQLKMPEQFEAFLKAIMNAMWVTDQNLNDPAVVGESLTKAGFDPAKMLGLTADADVKAVLRANTDEALARGAFGAPTIFVNDEMFFGQDRLEWVREALA